MPTWKRYERKTKFTVDAKQADRLEWCVTTLHTILFWGAFMKRIQTIVEEWHYQWLYEEAERQQISMASLLRHLLTEAIEHQQAAQTLSDPIFGIIGLGAGPADGITSENLDEYLYRLRLFGVRPATTCAKSFFL